MRIFNKKFFCLNLCEVIFKHLELISPWRKNKPTDKKKAVVKSITAGSKRKHMIIQVSNAHLPEGETTKYFIQYLKTHRAFPGSQKDWKADNVHIHNFPHKSSTTYSSIRHMSCDCNPKSSLLSLCILDNSRSRWRQTNHPAPLLASLHTSYLHVGPKIFGTFRKKQICNGHICSSLPSLYCI